MTCVTFHSPSALCSSSSVTSPTQQGLIAGLFPPQMEDLGMAPAVQAAQGTMPIFTSAFQRRAGGVLVASKLQSFLELAYRALRYLAEP